jgi:hypothetical protein
MMPYAARGIRGTSTRHAWSKRGPARSSARSPRARLDHDHRAYDNQKLENLQSAAAWLESGKSFDPTPREPASRTECQVSVKNSTEKPPSDRPKGGSKTDTKSLDDQELQDWLGGRDSNPDTVVQRAVHGLRYATVRAVSGPFSRDIFGPHRSALLRSRAMCLTVSHPF